MNNKFLPKILLFLLLSVTAFRSQLSAQCAQPNAVLDLFASGFSNQCTWAFPPMINDVANDTTGTLTLTGVSTPMWGTATFSGDTIYYTPDSAHAGAFDIFNYIICNACGACDTGQISVFNTVYPCNGNHPTINNDFGTVCRNDTIVLSVLGNDFDPDGDSIFIDSLVTLPGNGTITQVGNTIVYIPQENWFGSDVFFYKACDNGVPSICNLGQVSITVNQCANAPEITNDSSSGSGNIDTIYVSFPEGTVGVDCITFSDADADLAQITSITGNDYNVTGASGFSDTLCITFSPPTEYNGQDVVTVVICDEYPLCDTVVYIVNVTPVQDPPIAVDDVITVMNDQIGTVNVVGNDIDIDGDSLYVDSLYDDNDVNGTIWLNPNGTVSYEPDSTFAGVDTFYYIVTDGFGNFDVAMVTVKVPIHADDDYATTNEDTPVDLPLVNNDAQVNGYWVTPCSNPLNGTVSINSSTGVATYTPLDEYFGSDSFCYTLCWVPSAGDTECTNAMAYITVVDVPEPIIFFPHGFSPDGDGTNETFVIQNADLYPRSQLTVYNRWGDEVWANDGEGYKNDFDGKWKKRNQPLPDGSYFYIFKFNDGVTEDKIDYLIIQR